MSTTLGPARPRVGTGTATPGAWCALPLEPRAVRHGARALDGHVADDRHVAPERHVALDGEPLGPPQGRGARREARVEVGQQLEVLVVEVDERGRVALRGELD